MNEISFDGAFLFQSKSYTVSLKSKYAEVLSQDRETQNPYKGCFIEKRSNSDGQVKSYLIDCK